MVDFACNFTDENVAFLSAVKEYSEAVSMITPLSIVEEYLSESGDKKAKEKSDANSKAEEKKKSALSKMIDAIKDMIDKLTDKIRTFFIKKDLKKKTQKLMDEYEEVKKTNPEIAQMVASDIITIDEVKEEYEKLYMKLSKCANAAKFGNKKVTPEMIDQAAKDVEAFCDMLDSPDATDYPINKVTKKLDDILLSADNSLDRLEKHRKIMVALSPYKTSEEGIQTQVAVERLILKLENKYIGALMYAYPRCFKSIDDAIKTCKKHGSYIMKTKKTSAEKQHDFDSKIDDVTNLAKTTKRTYKMAIWK